MILFIFCLSRKVCILYQHAIPKWLTRELVAVVQELFDVSVVLKLFYFVFCVCVCTLLHLRIRKKIYTIHGPIF